MPGARLPRDGPRLVRPCEGEVGGSDRRGRRFPGRASVLSNSVAGNGASRRGLARRRHAARWRTGGECPPEGAGGPPAAGISCQPLGRCVAGLYGARRRVERAAGLSGSVGRRGGSRPRAQRLPWAYLGTRSGGDQFGIPGPYCPGSDLSPVCCKQRGLGQKKFPHFYFCLQWFQLQKGQGEP